MCSTELRSLVPSLEYLVSNGRQVLMEGIRLGGSAISFELENQRICSLIEFGTFFSQGLMGKSRKKAWELKVTNEGEREGHSSILGQAE